MTEKLPTCLGITYSVKYKGAEAHEVCTYQGQLSDVTHIGVALLVFDTNGFILNANKMISMERIE